MSNSKLTLSIIVQHLGEHYVRTNDRRDYFWECSYCSNVLVFNASSGYLYCRANKKNKHAARVLKDMWANGLRWEFTKGKK